MIVEDMECFIPNDWQPMDLRNEKYKIVCLNPLSKEFGKVRNFFVENTSERFYKEIQGIYRIQNPFLYTKFILKAHEYEQKGNFATERLFHDTAQENVVSIASYNFDWRYGERFMFGPGVYFSRDAYLANKHSSKNNGKFRAVFIAKVMMQNVQIVDSEIFLPDFGYDTVLAHNRETYVKYFDGDYYPEYMVDYVCA